MASNLALWKRSNQQISARGASPSPFSSCVQVSHQCNFLPPSIAEPPSSSRAQAGLPQPPIPVSIGNNSFTMFLENIGLAKSTTTSAKLGFSKLAIFVRKARPLNRHGNPAPPEFTSTMRDLARPTKKKIYLYL